jgi:hypothetical protein
MMQAQFHIISPTIITKHPLATFASIDAGQKNRWSRSGIVPMTRVVSETSIRAETVENHYQRHRSISLGYQRIHHVEN